MLKKIGTLRKKSIIGWAWLLLAMSAILFSDASLAVTLSDVGANVDDSAKIVAKIAKIVAAAAGFILVIVGVNAFIQASKQQQPKGMAIVMILGGAALLSAVAFTGVSTSSIFGGSSSGVSDLGLN